jgi:hypothetical protein
MFTLTVKIHGNPDRNEGDWQEVHSISASTIQDLRKAVNELQASNGIGGGNWGEAVVHEDRCLVGYMSYNGRVWKTPYWNTDAAEVILT